jgi:hypothetical protein
MLNLEAVAGLIEQAKAAELELLSDDLSAARLEQMKRSFDEELKAVEAPMKKARKDVSDFCRELAKTAVKNVEQGWNAHLTAPAVLERHPLHAVKLPLAKAMSKVIAFLKPHARPDGRDFKAFDEGLAACKERSGLDGEDFFNVFARRCKHLEAVSELPFPDASFDVRSAALFAQLARDAEMRSGSARLQ